IRVERKLKSVDGIDVPSDLFILRGVPAHPFQQRAGVRSQGGAGLDRDYWSQDRLDRAGQPLEIGFIESFNARLRDELLGGELISRRIANARLDPTFLMADVEVVATYELFNINRAKLENVIHRVFSPARLDVEIMDRFGLPIAPKEWFLVPLFAIDEAVEKIRDGTITGYVYDPKTATLTQA